MHCVCHHHGWCHQLSDGANVPDAVLTDVFARLMVAVPATNSAQPGTCLPVSAIQFAPAADSAVAAGHSRSKQCAIITGTDYRTAPVFTGAVAGLAAVWFSTFAGHFRFAYWPGVWLGSINIQAVTVTTFAFTLAAATGTAGR